MAEQLTQAALDLGRGVRRGRRDLVRGAAARLVGLGQGLTPPATTSSAASSSPATAEPQPARRMSRRLAPVIEAVRLRLGQTTDISAAFLRDALAGRISRPLAELVEACCSALGSDLGAALLRLAAIGHSSGLDAATGFFYGATIWGDATDPPGARRRRAVRTNRRRRSMATATMEG